MITNVITNYLRKLTEKKNHACKNQIFKGAKGLIYHGVICKFWGLGAILKEIGFKKKKNLDHSARDTSPASPPSHSRSLPLS